MEHSIKYKSALLKELYSRGFIYQCTNIQALDQLLATKLVNAYIGFDCTSNSLHIGSLVQIMLLKHIQLHGHNPFIVLGSGTSLVGDPSGKDKSRTMLDEQIILSNKKAISKTLSHFITCNTLDNYKWLGALQYIEFLRNYAPYFTVNRMLSFESVKNRLERESPLTFLEFNYMILQAIDFMHLHKSYNITLQLGGSDQWGNIISGIELIKKTSQQEVFGLTSPLIINSNGTKMGKTEQGAIWLDKTKIKVWDFYQFWRNTEDSDVIKYLKLFTMIPLSTIDSLSHLKGSDLNRAKKLLAFDITKLCFDESQADKCEKISVDTFEKKQLSENLPFIALSSTEIKSNISIIDLIMKTEYVSSRSNARKLIQNRGVKVNDIPIINLEFKFIYKENTKLSIGKKQHYLIKITQ